MRVKDQVVVVTGGASGIGRALCRRFAADGARAVVVADRDERGAALVAAEIGGHAQRVDVAREDDLLALIESTESTHGAIALFCSNAGIGVSGGAEVADAEWQRIWEINLMSHVYAARHLVPRMSARGGGYLLNTASAAGLLSQIGSAPYAVTKHAAVAFAEWLAITHGREGIKVSVLCPQAVRTAMTAGNLDGVASIDGLMEPEELASVCIRSLEAEDFLILPHPVELDYIQRKSGDYNRWIGGMRKLARRFGG